MKKIIYYLDRLLSVLIVCFFAAFVLEGFSPQFTWMDSLAHLVPTLIVLGITFVAWKKPKIGGWLFVLFGLFCLVFLGAKSGTGIAIALVPFVAGLLFLSEATFKK